MPLPAYARSSEVWLLLMTGECGVTPQRATMYPTTVSMEEPMSNLFTKYFQGRGLKQMREEEEQRMAAEPQDDEGANGGPYRASDPQPDKMKWVTYEKPGSRSSWLLSFTQKLGKFLVAWLILLYTANCSRPMYDAPIRLCQCIAMLCLVWCVTYVRIKKVPA